MQTEVSWYKNIIHCILRDTELVPTRTRPDSAPFFSLCVSLLLGTCVLSEVLHPGEGSEVVTSLVTLQGGVLFVGGAWTTTRRDPKSGWNSWIFCVTKL